MMDFSDVMKEAGGRINSGKKNNFPSVGIMILVKNRFPSELHFVERTVAGYIFYLDNI